MPHHRHCPIETLHLVHGWTHCVAKLPASCQGASHGGVTHRDECGCGAYRFTESNGRHVKRGAWIMPSKEGV